MWRSHGFPWKMLYKMLGKLHIFCKRWRVPTGRTSILLVEAPFFLTKNHYVYWLNHQCYWFLSCGSTISAWWLIPLSKWVITPVISGLTLLIPFITGVITHLRAVGWAIISVDTWDIPVALTQTKADNTSRQATCCPTIGSQPQPAQRCKPSWIPPKIWPLMWLQKCS